MGEGLCLTLPCSNAVAGERYTGYDNRYRSDEVCPRPETSDCDCNGIDRSIWDVRLGLSVAASSSSYLSLVFRCTQLFD